MPVGAVFVGNLTYAGSAVVELGAASATLLAAAPNRRHAIFLNQSATITAYLDIGADAVIGTSAIKLAPGDSYEMTAGRNLTTQAVTGIAASACNVSALQGLDAAP